MDLEGKQNIVAFGISSSCWAVQFFSAFWLPCVCTECLICNATCVLFCPTTHAWSMNSFICTFGINGRKPSTSMSGCTCVIFSSEWVIHEKVHYKMEHLSALGPLDFLSCWRNVRLPHWSWIIEASGATAIVQWQKGIGIWMKIYAHSLENE